MKHIVIWDTFNEQKKSFLLAVGAKGDEVKKVQSKLIELGFLKISNPTGNYGIETKKAVEQFQRKSGFVDKQKASKEVLSSGKIVDGLVGPVTYNLLFNKPVEKKPVVDEKLLKDVNLNNPNAKLLFDGLNLSWVVDGKVHKKWKAISGLTIGNVKSSAQDFISKAKDTAKLLYFSGRLKFMKQKEAGKFKEVGPTPPGFYTTGPLESREGKLMKFSAVNSWWNWFTGKLDTSKGGFQDDTEWSKIAWGNYRMPLIPKKSTDTFGRSGFYIHGGSIAGSHGCIDLGDDMDDFAKYYSAWMVNTKKTSIDVEVNYETYDESGIFTKFYQYVSRLGD